MRRCVYGPYTSAQAYVQGRHRVRWRPDASQCACVYSGTLSPVVEHV
ncbi:hypothetical protein chiPu_0024933, partial [Chiloscyllium punctatum]|nr:hypothetical protein [Chiloscyllium punctatum]